MNDLVFQIVLTILGATVGAGIGTFLAIRKTRNETAFARRLQWCEEAMKSFNVAGAAIVSAQQTTLANSASEACWKEAIQCYEKLIPLCGQKEIYATKKSIDAINDFMKAFYDLIEAHLASHNKINLSDGGNSCLEKLKNASVILAKEARKHLGIWSLPEKYNNPNSKFVGSFRGRDLYDHEK